MNSHRYVLRQSGISKLLEISEHTAACCGFDSKDILLIRLLTEEMISAVRSGIALVPGTLWFSSGDGMLCINISVRTNFFGITKEDRIKLVKQIDGKKRTGIFAPIQEFLDKLAVADEKDGAPEAVKGAVYTGNEGDWEMGGMGALPADDEAGLEISLLKGFADDFKAMVKAKTLTLKVMKKLPDDFALFYIESDS